ncbi:MAG TPA: hypothetical protein VMW36_04135 [Patescibacteria group bacterium]|nr:hypothetical protein [Patescibacteria group bacterium]
MMTNGQIAQELNRVTELLGPKPRVAAGANPTRISHAVRDIMYAAKTLTREGGNEHDIIANLKSIADGAIKAIAEIKKGADQDSLVILHQTFNRGFRG